jgi:hypothetical protein
MWTEDVVVYFKALPNNLPEGPEKIHDKSQSELQITKSRYKLGKSRIGLSSGSPKHHTAPFGHL